MRTTGPDRAWVGALLVVVAGLLAGAATGINMNQVRTAAPGAVNVGGVSAAEGSSLAAARADHAHSLSGILPGANGGMQVAQPTCAANQRLTCTGTSCSCSQVLLTQVGNPAGDTTFTFPSGAKQLFTFTGATDVAYSIHGDGAFTGNGDLVHLHLQGTPGVAAGADVLHVEWEDTDATGLRLSGPSAASPALVATGTVNVTGAVTASSFAGPLTGAVTGNASTASALDHNPAACGAGTYATDIAADGALTCGTPAGTYTLPAASTTLGGVKMAAACGAGNHVSSIGAGGELACTADAGGGGGYATVQDEGGALTTRTVLNFAGAGISCADDTTRTTCTVAGGGGGDAPGGADGTLQYRVNSTTLGGVSRVTTDGTDLIFTGTATPPSAPAAGSLKVWAARPHGASGPALPYWMGGSTQVDYRLFPEVLSSDPVWGCLQPAAYGSTTITPVGSMQAGGATGTPALVAWAATDERTRAKWVQYPSATTASSSAGLRAGVDYMWRGNAAGLGGFYWWGSFAIAGTVPANQRLFIGLKDAVAVITATTNPSAALDMVGFWCDAGQTTIRVGSNDNSGSSSNAVDLGASFPCTTTGIGYDVALWAAPNGASVGYYIRRLVGGQEASGTISTDLPRNTVGLGWDTWINNGGTAAAATMHFGGTCYIANP